MSPTDWDKEMAKIDRQLESISDEALLPSSGARSPAEKDAIVSTQGKTRTLGVLTRLLLAVVLGVAMIFWPYSTRCGAGLFGYFGPQMLGILRDWTGSFAAGFYMVAIADVLTLGLISLLYVMTRGRTQP